MPDPHPSTPARRLDDWLDPAFDLAWRILRDREEAADVVLRVFAGQSRSQPFDRRLLLEVRHEALAAVGKSQPPSEAEAAVLFARAGDGDAYSEAELVWGASQALGPADASLLQLSLVFGLGPDELDPSGRLTKSDLGALARRLPAAAAAWTLWAGGQPRCPELRGTLASTNATQFGPRVTARIARHARTCRICGPVAAEHQDVVHRFMRAPLRRAPQRVRTPFERPEPEQRPPVSLDDWELVQEPQAPVKPRRWRVGQIVEAVIVSILAITWAAIIVVVLIAR
jgi:hypothetical protein